MHYAILGRIYIFDSMIFRTHICVPTRILGKIAFFDNFFDNKFVGTHICVLNIICVLFCVTRLSSDIHHHTKILSITYILTGYCQDAYMRRYAIMKIYISYIHLITKINPLSNFWDYLLCNWIYFGILHLFW